MNKYYWLFYKTEKIGSSLNDFLMSVLLLELKKIYNALGKESMNNRDVINRLLLDYGNFPNDQKKFYKKKVIDKINVNSLYRCFLMNCSTYLLYQDFENTKLFFKSFIDLGLIDSAEIIDNDDHKVIELITPSMDRMRFSHVSLRKELIDVYRGNCHAVTSIILRQDESFRPQKTAVVLENNELIGSGYHSFIVNNGLICDYAHNIVMLYEDYLKLINPKVLVYGDSTEVLSKMKVLKEEDRDFRESEMIDVLKYGISKQSKIKCKTKSS